MKNTLPLFSLLIVALLLGACSTSYKPYAYDDVYYSPKNDPIKKVEKDPRDDFNKSNNQYDGSYPNRYNEADKHEDYPKAMYQNRYADDKNNENNQNYIEGENNSYYNGQQNDEYYDGEYVNTINEINSPVRRFNSYDPYTRDRIIYTADPFFASPSLYGSYQFWDPYYSRSGLSLGYSSWGGWNIGFNYNIGYGRYGYNPYGYRSPFYDPFYYRYNPWSPYGYGYGYGHGYGINNYWSGYNHGFHNGYYHGNYYGGSFSGGESGGSSGSGVRRINTPRGSSGSKNYGEQPAEGRPDRRSTTPTSIEKAAPTESIGSRPDRNQINNQMNKTPKDEMNPAGSERPLRNTAPEKYPSNKSQEDYHRPAPTNNARDRQEVRPSQNNLPVSPSSQPSAAPSQSRPSSSPESRPSRVAPQQQSSPSMITQPQQRVQPSNNRPSYNNPTYSRPQQQESRPSRVAPQQQRQSSPSMNAQPQQRVQPNNIRPSYNNPTYSRPAQNKQPSRVAPQQQRQSSPAINHQPQQRSQPSFNNTPSHSPSMGGSRGGGGVSQPSRGGSRPRR